MIQQSPAVALGASSSLLPSPRAQTGDTPSLRQDLYPAPATPPPRQRYNLSSYKKTSKTMSSTTVQGLCW